MSDDDLWRRPHDQQPSSEPPADDAADEGPAEPSVNDETQPISGVGSVPPPPPGPSADPPSAPSAVPPPANPYGQAAGQQTQGWNPYVDPRDPGASAARQPTTPYPQGYGPGYQQGYQQPYGPGPGQGYVPPHNPYPPPQEYGAPQNPYGSPYQPAYAGGLMPAHPTATTSMVLAIVGLASILVCAGALLILSPFAWVLGAKAVREIDASQGRYSGRDRAMAGKVMGIIGTVLLVLGVLLVVAIVVIAVNSDPSGPTTPAYDQNL